MDFQKPTEAKAKTRAQRRQAARDLKMMKNPSIYVPTKPANNFQKDEAKR